MTVNEGFAFADEDTADEDMDTVRARGCPTDGGGAERPVDEALAVEEAETVRPLG